MQTQWGGLSLPVDGDERRKFIDELLRQYTQLQIDGDPVLKYLQDTEEK
jgi:hypothetical protein